MRLEDIMKHQKLVFILSLIILVLTVTATLGGLLIPSLYQDNERFVTIWQSNDLITLVIAVPLLIYVLFRSFHKLTPRLLMTWIGLLLFLFYNYSYYVFGASFNALYLIYLFIYTLSIPALIYSVVDLMKFNLINAQSKKIPNRLLAGYMIFIAFGLSVVYIMQSLSFVMTGVLPAIITASGHVTSIVFTLDFSMVILFYVIAAIYLIKKNPIGIALAWIFNIKSVIYMLVLSYGSYRTESAEIGLWLTIGLFSAIALVLIYKHLNTIQIDNK